MIEIGLGVVGGAVVGSLIGRTRRNHWKKAYTDQAGYVKDLAESLTELEAEAGSCRVEKSGVESELTRQAHKVEHYARRLEKYESI